MTVRDFPTPAALGLDPQRYPAFRPGQVAALEWLLAHRETERVKGLCIPPGGGKSAIAAAYAHLTGQRTAILVGTRSLQTQYAVTLGLTVDPMVALWADLRGQGNYACHQLGKPHTADMGTCHSGGFCLLQTGGCDYFDTVRAAGGADVVVFSFASWLSVMGDRGAEGRPMSPGTLIRQPRGGFQCLILDEGDTALEWLSLHLGVEVTERPLRRAGLPGIPAEGTDMAAIAQWGGEERDRVTALVKLRGAAMGQVERSEWRRISDALTRLTAIAGELPDSSWAAWVPEWEGEAGGPWRRLRLSPVWPARHREVLLQGVGDVIVMSATLTAGMVDALAGNEQGQ